MSFFSIGIIGSINFVNLTIKKLFCTYWFSTYGIESLLRPIFSCKCHKISLAWVLQCYTTSLYKQQLAGFRLHCKIKSHFILVYLFILYLFQINRARFPLVFTMYVQFWTKIVVLFLEDIQKSILLIASKRRTTCSSADWKNFTKS